MKVDKLISANQPEGWFERITQECKQEYPIYMMNDIEGDELIIDAGCNVGGFAEAYKERFTNFLAIDASSYNIEHYQSHHTHPTLHKALYSKDGELVKLQKYMINNGTHDTNSGNFSISGHVDSNGHGWNSEEYEEVETLSLDTLLSPYDSVGLLKIDIEGGEFDFLLGMDLSKIKWITGEFHNFLGKVKQDELFEWITKTHNLIYSDGDGVESHYVKLYKRR